MTSLVSVFIEGNDNLGKVFGSTARVKTSVFNVPASMSGISAALARVDGTAGAVVVVPAGYTTTLTPTQISAALDKLSTYTTPVVAYLGTSTDKGRRQALYLNGAAVDLVKKSIVQEPVQVPTMAGDDVPGAEYKFVPSPTVSNTSVVIGARALDTLDIESYIASLLASNTIQKVDVGVLFVDAPATTTAATSTETTAATSTSTSTSTSTPTAPVPAPAQVDEYSAWMVSSPVSQDSFQGSPSVGAGGAITYYDPSQDGGADVAAPVQQDTSSEIPPVVIVTNDTSTSPTTQCAPASSSMTSSWWLWLIIVIIILVLLIVSVVVYYRKK